MRITKYYFTEQLIRRIGSWKAVEVINRVAALEGRRLDLKAAQMSPKELSAAILKFDDGFREEVNAAFRNIQGVGRCPKVKPAIIQVMRGGGIVQDNEKATKLLEQMNSRNLYRIAAHLFCTFPDKMWREVCLMARRLRVAESAWLTFGVCDAPDKVAVDAADEALESLRKRICEFIFENEGRADEGWCSYYYDEINDEHNFVVDMTDHLSERKERVAKNRFHVVPRKEVFDILFRYKPQLSELSIRAEGPRDYRKYMCMLWIEEIMHGAATLDDTRHKYQLDGVLGLPSMVLKVGAESPVTRAEIESVELVSAIYDDFRMSWRSKRGDLQAVVKAAIDAAGIPRSELCVGRIEIRFSYLDRNGESVHDVRYVRPDATNIVRAPDAIKLAIPKILEDNGIAR